MFQNITNTRLRPTFVFHSNIHIPSILATFNKACAELLQQISFRITMADYEVSTINLQNISIEELNQRNLIALIPFQLLKMRRLLATNRAPEVIEHLQNLLFCDILGSIRKNIQSGKLSPDDASRLHTLTGLLLRDLYGGYEETKEVCDMYDHSLVLDVDEHIEEKERLRQELEQKNEELSEKNEELSEKNEQLLQKDEALSKMEAENARLKAELAKRN